ncbi:HET-domain-containing protein [Fusarium austroafricanum]|uniref:HET-domain-containing protein n=1 Tax=Fusarium austroafricanum TaxID=2364996 RepID=A0A8H4KSH1_9HYPO|nr:HET-domain-containing protein [Fusarium austroafricanum]
MPFCSVCHDLDIAEAPPDQLYLRALDVIQKNASLGCDLCSLVIGIALDHAISLPGNTENLNDYIFCVHLSLSGNGTCIEKPEYNKILVKVTRRVGMWTDDEYVKTSMPTDSDHEICIAADPDSLPYKSGFIGGRFLGPDIAAPEYVHAIGDWIQQCISSHEDCCKSISDGKSFDPYQVDLPTRCIEVTSTTAFLKATHGMKGSYVALSHRWNQETETVKTTSSNYETRISGSDLGSLTKTFQDAITLVRRLGLQYLWVDSICIIQGSEDWDREKWKMGQYYEHALFTISAIGSVSQDTPSPGFLKARLPKSLVRLPFRQNGTRQGSVYLYKREKKDYMSFHADVEASELNSRGWVFQERLLSKRIIYFTNEESFLECRSRIPQSFCNDLIEQPSEHLVLMSVSKKRPILPKHAFKINFGSETASPLNTWYTIVEAFSRTKLTKQSDHLAAISGAASEYGQAIETQMRNGQNTQPIQNYLSGLWLQDIHYGLMWFAFDGKNRTCPCGAPSWSWLSYQGSIGWPPRDIKSQPALQVLGGELEEVAQGASQSPDVVIMTAKLHVKSRIQSVFVVRDVLPREREDIGPPVVSNHDRKRGRDLGLMSFYDCLKNGSYPVIHPSSPDLTGGWGIFEKAPPVQEWAGSSSGKVLAIHVASRREGGGPGLLGEYLNLERTVYDVIYVEFAGDNIFKRIGAGMIFDRNIMKGFERCEDTEMILI